MIAGDIVFFLNEMVVDGTFLRRHGIIESQDNNTNGILF